VNSALGEEKANTIQPPFLYFSHLRSIMQISQKHEPEDCRTTILSHAHNPMHIWNNFIQQLYDVCAKVTTHE